MALNTRQALFVEHYLRLNNATQAAIEAGYSQRGAGQTAHKLLKNAEIAARVRDRTTEVLKSRQMEADEVLARMADIARGDIRVFVNGSDFSLDAHEDGTPRPTQLIRRIKTRKKSRALADESTETEVEQEIELYDAQAALVTLGKHWKLWDRSAEDDDRELEALLAEMGVSVDEVFDEALRLLQARRAAASA